VRLDNLGMCFLHALLGILDFDNAEYGLLNCLDGATSKDGRTFCMTSNTLGRLDHAPVKPGRSFARLLGAFPLVVVSSRGPDDLPRYARTAKSIISKEELVLISSTLVRTWPSTSH
jgi:hypothetical protein